MIRAARSLATLDRAYAAATGTIGASLALQFVVTVGGVLAARMLGVTDRGRLATLWLIILIPAQLGTLGMPSAVTYFVARDPSAARPILRSLRHPGRLQALALVAVQAATLALVLSGEPNKFVVAGLLTLAVLPTIVAHEYGLALLQGLQRFRIFNLMRMLPATLYAIALTGAFLTVAHPGLELVTGLWVATSCVAGISSLGVAMAGLPPSTSPRPIGVPTIRSIRGFGLRSVLGTATVLEQLQLDQAIVGLLLAQTQLGLYVTAVAFANLPRFIGQAIGIVAYPDVAATLDPREARRRVVRYALIDVAVCGAIGVGIELLVGRLLPFFFGEAFAAAVPVARILVLSGVIQSARRVLADGARGVGKPGLVTCAEICSWIVLAPSVALLTPSLGLRGVAYALVVAPSVATVVIVVGLRFWRPAGREPRPSAGTLIQATGVADSTGVERI